MVFWLLFSNESIQNILILSATVAPFASAGIRPVVNRLNQDTTVYYGLVFCLFSWPYMVKWHNSGIIIHLILFLWCFCLSWRNKHRFWRIWQWRFDTMLHWLIHCCVCVCVWKWSRFSNSRGLLPVLQCMPQKGIWAKEENHESFQANNSPFLLQYIVWCITLLFKTCIKI